MQIHSSTTSLVCITISNSPNPPRVPGLVFRWGQNVNTDKVLYCLIVAVPFCIRNLLNSRLGLSGCFRFGAPALKCFDLFGIEYKIWTSPDLNSMRWLGLFTNKTFRKHLKLNFPHRDFMLCIVSLTIFLPHFISRIFPSAFYHPHFSIRHPPSAAIRSALYRDPMK